LIEDAANVYIEAGTAQGYLWTLKKYPCYNQKKASFRIGQIGKAFRNEIKLRETSSSAPCEFEQMEIRVFFWLPETQSGKKYSKMEWEKIGLGFYCEYIGGFRENHFALGSASTNKVCEFVPLLEKAQPISSIYFRLAGAELCAAAAYRTDFDLKQHQKIQRRRPELYRSRNPQRKIVSPCDWAVVWHWPHRFSHSSWCLRRRRNWGWNQGGTPFKPQLAPIKVAILPLVKNKEIITNKAREIYHELKKQFTCEYGRVRIPLAKGTGVRTWNRDAFLRDNRFWHHRKRRLRNRPGPRHHNPDQGECERPFRHPVRKIRILGKNLWLFNRGFNVFRHNVPVNPSYYPMQPKPRWKAFLDLGPASLKIMNLFQFCFRGKRKKTKTYLP